MKYIKSISLRNLLVQARAAFQRFPGVLLCAFIATAMAIYFTYLKAEFKEWQPLFSVLLGLPLFLTTTFWRESKGHLSEKHRIVELLAGTLFIVGHYYLTKHDASENYLLRYAQVSLALHLAVSFVASIENKNDNGFWQLNKSIFVRILGSFLYASVFYIGLVIALVAVRHLFSLTFEENIYLYLWFFSAFVFQTWHFLAGLPKNLRELNHDTSYPTPLRIFVQNLLIPLVSLYTVILYCYMIKILITRVWPSGNVGWLVSIMSVLGILNLLLIDPEKDKSESRWIKTYVKTYYILVIPLLGMLFGAVGKRIAEYGVTEQRYCLLVLGLFLAAMAIYFIFSRSKSIKVIPMALCALVLVTSTGPWSVYNVSKNSQLKRAEVILLRNGMLKDGQVTKTETELVGKDSTELYSIFSYLVAHHGVSSVAHWFPNDLIKDHRNIYYSELNFSSSSAQPLFDFMNLKSGGVPVVSNNNLYFLLNSEFAVINISGFANVLFIEAGMTANHEFTTKGSKVVLYLDGETNILEIREADQVFSKFALNELIDKLHKTENMGRDLPAEKLTVESMPEGKKARFIIKSLYGEIKDGKNNISSVQGTMFF